MRKALHFAALFSIACLLLSCDSKHDGSKQEASIGPQFWLYDMTDYTRTHLDVLSGLGGRWISVRYQAKVDSKIDRAAKVREIVGAFTSDGWRQEALPKIKYVMSDLYETAADDLYFRRMPQHIHHQLPRIRERQRQHPAPVGIPMPALLRMPGLRRYPARALGREA